MQANDPDPQRRILQEKIFSAKTLDVIRKGLEQVLEDLKQSQESAGFDEKYLSRLPSDIDLIISYIEYLEDTPPQKSQLLNLANHPPALSQIFAMVELLIYFNKDNTQSGDLIATYRKLQTTIELLICLNGVNDGEVEPYEI